MVIDAAYIAYVAARIERRSIPVTESGCWIWDGYLDSCGYGRTGFANEQQSAHRVSWKVFRGPIPKGLCVLHRCDVPSCVNPDHLFLGTQIDNIDDMTRKGRARGKNWLFGNLHQEDAHS